MQDTVLLTCGALKAHIDAAQERMGTDYPVVYVDRSYHDRPKEMRLQIIQALQGLPEEVHTVLVGMAFCGGAWEEIETEKRLVIPRVDDCLTMLLHRDEDPRPARKETGHLYLLADEAADIFSPMVMYQEYCQQFDADTARMLLDMYFENYTTVDVIDTGVGDCRSEECRQKAEKNAEMIRCGLQYVPGSNQMLEKLLSGQWEERLFWVLEPGEVLHSDALCDL